ncbi:hypothetical protein ACQKNB_10680, partial [Lysinibacillus xylanilyticus]|uniref:hypothetical protein n=1 Tax=Lysinibacillus xylanilyticus TaxID=582475 RepID=UPI003D05885E
LNRKLPDLYQDCVIHISFEPGTCRTHNRARLLKIVPTLLPKKKAHRCSIRLKRDLVTNSIYNNFRSTL